MLATISSGHVDFADICFLVAVILAAVVAILSAVKGSVEGALLPAAIGFLALGLLVL